MSGNCCRRPSREYARCSGKSIDAAQGTRGADKNEALTDAIIALAKQYGRYGFPVGYKLIELGRQDYPVR
jgi:hypothetical protein